MAPWVYDPQSGGNKIPPRNHDALRQQAETFASTREWYPRMQLSLRFKYQFCYVDTIEGGDDRLSPLCRLRHFHQESWSLALFTYSNSAIRRPLFQTGNGRGHSRPR